MIELNIPGRGLLLLNHLVCDANGSLIMGLSRTLPRLRDRLIIHLVTANTYARQDEIDKLLTIPAVRLQPGDEAAQKATYVRSLGAEQVIAIGQGANDALMLAEAALGICIQSREGLAVAPLNAADILATDIHAALELIEKPIRIVATLRK